MKKLPLVKLENVFEHSSKNPIVVVDCRVQIFQIMSKLSKFHEKFAQNDQGSGIEWGSEEYDDLVDGLAFAFWMSILNDPLPWLPKPSGGYRVIVVDDWKYDNGTYWRSGFVPDYKGNRDVASRPKLYYRIYDQFNKIIDHPKCKINVLRKQGFEADDFAGVVWREWLKIKSKPELFLLTVDGDWKQLVVDGCYFACARPYEFRLQSTYEVLREYLDKGQIMRNTSSIARYKVKFGDSSDNLKPGSPIGVIDLREPELLPDLPKGLKIIPSRPNVNLEQAEKGQKHLVQWEIFE